MDGSTIGQLPSCYGWHDKLDPSCRRCSVRESCKSKQAESRPVCFAELYDGSHPECKACLDSSQCLEEMTKMATPKIRIKRAPATAEAPVVEAELPEPVAEEPVVADEPEEEEVAEATSVYDELSVDELRAELTSRKLDATGRRSALQERLEADDAKPAPKPVVKTAAQAAQSAQAKVAAAKASNAKPAAAPKTVAPAAAPKPIQPKPQPPIDGDKDTLTVLGSNFQTVLEAMANGMTLVIARSSKNEWSMVLINSADMVKASPVAAVAAGAKVAGTGLRGDAYWREVLTPEYYSWYYEDAGAGKAWSQMSADEKNAFVDATGVVYEASEDSRLNAMRQVEALLIGTGIKKYKDQYTSAKARDAIKA